jgi:hypothetical protein
LKKTQKREKSSELTKRRTVIIKAEEVKAEKKEGIRKVITKVFKLK